MHYQVNVSYSDSPIATEDHAVIESQNLFLSKMIKPHHYIYTDIPYKPFKDISWRNTLAKMRIEATLHGSDTRAGL